MPRTRAPMMISGFLAALLATACAEPSAYVFSADEFNRASPNFAKDPQNIDSVTICYNKYGTKPELIANMAAAECGKFNKRAEFRRQSFEVCPLITPVAAEYRCVGGN